MKSNFIAVSTLTVLMMLCAAVTYSASPTKSVQFKPFSGYSSITCNVWGQSQIRQDAHTVPTPIQAFAPDNAYSRTFKIGTGARAGYGNYSTVYNGGKTPLTYFYFSCFQTATSNLIPVQVYLNWANVAVYQIFSQWGFAVGQ